MKAAVHYTTGQLCEEVGEEMTASKQFIAVLSEATFKYSQRMATDLELFAKSVLLYILKVLTALFFCEKIKNLKKIWKK